MAASVISPVAIEGPTRAPAKGGLLAVANVIPYTDVHLGMGVSYVAEGFNGVALAPSECWNDDDLFPPSGSTKDFEGIDSLISTPFPVYAGIDCGAAYSEEYAARARRKLEGGEGRAVERALEGAFLQGGTPVATSPADDLVAAIAALEQILYQNYAGLPLIHASRAITTRLIAARLAFPQPDGTVETGQGTPIANGDYLSDFLYGTGQVNIWQGPIVDRQAVDPEYNRARALAERIYSITIDGPVYAVDITP
jgi:hypothetical protein